MGDEVRRRLISEKSSASGQRRRREALLKRLPAHLSDLLGKSACIYFPEQKSFLQSVAPITRSGVGTPAFVPSNYAFQEVAWERKVLPLLRENLATLDFTEGFLLLEAPRRQGFQGDSSDLMFWGANTPLFIVDFRSAFPIMSDLWPYCEHGICLFERSLRAGVLVNRFQGLLEEDPNPQEVGYEIARWPVIATTPALPPA